MQHLNKTTVRLTLLIMLVMGVVSISVSAQQTIMTEFIGDVPIVIGDYKIMPGGILEDMPSDRAPSPSACDNAAGSYVSAGIDAIRTTMVQFDNIVYDNKDPELVLYALYALEANEFAGADYTYDNLDDRNKVGNFTDGMVTVMGDESVCLAEDSMTIRLWELEDGTWVIDTISFSEPIDISEAWNVNPSPQLDNVQFDLPVLVDGLVLRYLMPYIEPPVTTVPGASDDKFVPNEPLCEGTGPSNLFIGANVQFFGYGYSEFPTNLEDHWTEWQFNGTKLALSDYGSGVYNDIRGETPVTSIVGNFESVAMSAADLYDGIKFGKVVDGPYCTSINAEPSSEANSMGIVEASDPDHDRFYTWWRVDINGTVGWYPEVVGQYSHWLYWYEGKFDRKLTMYFMTPINMSQAVPETCPPSILYGGLEVEPAVGAMNLRTEPKGDVMGRFNMGETVILSSGPVCEGGSNWWWTDRGFLAENDPETSVALLVPAIQKVREAVIIEETTDETVVTPVPSQPEPQETREPDTNDDDDKDRDKDKDKDKDKEREPEGSSTPTFSVATSRAGSSACDPATGAGC